MLDRLAHYLVCFLIVLLLAHVACGMLFPSPASGHRFSGVPYTHHQYHPGTHAWTFIGD